MTNNQDAIKKTSNYIKRSITLKIVSVGFLILLQLHDLILACECSSASRTDVEIIW